MIDLRRFRERRLLRYKSLALFIISSAYLLIMAPTAISLVSMQQQKKTLSAQVQAQAPQQPVISDVMKERLVVINELAWAKRRYIVTLINRLAHLPQDVVLVSLACHQLVCEADVASEQVQTLMQVAAHDELKDLKQGGCPLCYHAKINIILS